MSHEYRNLVDPEKKSADHQSPSVSSSGDQKFHGNPSNSWDISVGTKVAEHPNREVMRLELMFY